MSLKFKRNARLASKMRNLHNIHHLLPYFLKIPRHAKYAFFVLHCFCESCKRLKVTDLRVVKQQ